MSNATIVFDVGQRAVFPIFGFLVPPMISAIMYWIARRRIKREDGESHASRMYFFYNTLAGALFGLVVGRMSSLRGIVMGSGFMAAHVLLFARKIYTGYKPRHYHMLDEDFSLDETSVVKHQTTVIPDPQDPSVAKIMFAQTHKYHETHTRQWVLAGLAVVLCAMAGVDTITIVAARPTDALSVAQVMLSHFSMSVTFSVAVFSAMMHAEYHLVENTVRRRTWWIAASALWGICYGCASSIPILAGLTWESATMVAQTVELGTYGLMGVLLVLCVYFVEWQDVGWTDRRERLLGNGVFAAAMVQAIGFSVLRQSVPLF